MRYNAWDPEFEHNLSTLHSGSCKKANAKSCNIKSSLSRSNMEYHGFGARVGRGGGVFGLTLSKSFCWDCFGYVGILL